MITFREITDGFSVSVGRSVLTLSCILILIFFSACDSESKKTTTSRPRVLTTTLMLEEGVSQILSETAEVQSLMGAGVDPHLFRPSARDLSLLREADLIVVNGLHLEGRLGEVLSILGKQKPVLVIADGLSRKKLLQAEYDSALSDPHIWMDPVLWSEGMVYLSRELAKWHPADSAEILLRGIAYRDSLLRLDSVIRAGLNTVPVSRRVLITSHDAFRYFGRAYQWEVKGLQGISTASDIGIREIQNLVDFISSRKIPVVFPEASVSPRNLEAVISGCRQRGISVLTGPVMYTDAPGTSGTEEATYSGMLLHNQKILSEWLRK